MAKKKILYYESCGKDLRKVKKVSIYHNPFYPEKQFCCEEHKVTIEKNKQAIISDLKQSQEVSNNLIKQSLRDILNL